MNSITQKLIAEAGTDISGKWISIDNAEKFAELIVRECMSNLYLNGYDDAVMQIKKHFGVEL
jgi:hypothetical protein